MDILRHPVNAFLWADAQKIWRPTMVAIRNICVLTLALLVLDPFSTAMTAQGAATREQRALVRAYLKGNVQQSAEADAAVKADVTDQLSRMVTKEPSASAAKARGAFMTVYLQSPPRDENTRACRAAVIATCLDLCGKVIKGNQPAFVKINFMALLAELDDGMSAEGNPVPSAAAMVELYKYAVNESAPAYLRAIALYGLERHIGERWATFPDGSKTTISTALAKIADSEPASFQDIKDNAWLVRRAYDCLGTARSDAAKGKAIERLADPKALPSLRLSAVEYLAKLDVATFSPEEKTEYFFGLTNMLRNQLVAWHELEQDRLRIATGGGAAGGFGGEGGYGGGYGGGPGMGPGMGGGGYGGGPGMGGGMGGYGGGEGGYGGGFGGGFGAGGRGSRIKPIDTQSWQTIAARRYVNHLTQAVHLALDGKQMAEENRSLAVIKPLLEAGMPESLQPSVEDLVESLDGLQTQLNNPVGVTDINGLLNQVREPIIDVMYLATQVPGFLERYPEIAKDEGLPVTPAAPQIDPGAPDGGPPVDGGDPGPDGDGG